MSRSPSSLWLVLLVCLLSGIGVGCDGGDAAVWSAVKPTVSRTTGPDSAAQVDTSSLTVTVDQLIREPMKFFGQNISFGGVVTDLGPGFVVFGSIIVYADLVPAVRLETSATIIGVCRGVENGMIVIAEGIIIPSCEVA